MTGPPAADYRVGVRAFNLELILKWIPRVLLGRKRYPFLPIPGRGQALAASLGLLSPRQKLDLTSSEDIRPGIAELLKIVRKFGSKFQRRMATMLSSRRDRGESLS